MKFNVISSGSKGNLTYIETEQIKCLIDAGISVKEIRLRSNIDVENIQAIFVTHDHIDHVCHLIRIARESNAVIYIEKSTFEAFAQKKDNASQMEGLKFVFVEANKKYRVGDLTVYTLMLSHDTSSCLGYVFSDGRESLAYITDTGFLPIPYLEVLRKVDALIIEANHDIELLNKSSRPWYLKERILSVKGHMSNVICGQIVNTVLSAKKLKVLVLAHLSEECNTEELAVDTVLGLIEGEYLPKIAVARQYEATGLMGVLDGR